MKRSYLLVIIAVGAAMILSACSGNSNTSDDEAYPGMPSGGEVLTQTEGITLTEDISPSVGITPTVGALETMPVVVTSTPGEAATQAPASTEALPSTGVIDPGLVTTLLDFDVYDQKGNQVGDAEDLVVDLETGQITYLVVNMDGSYIPVPWLLVTVVTSTTQSDSTAVGPQNDFVLSVDKDVLTGAPGYAEGEFPNTQTTDWDMAVQSYWKEYIPVGS